MSKSLQNAEQKRATIIRSALDLFLEQGYAATGMDAVASLAGVTKQTVYRYYASKEKLFTAVMAKIQADEPPRYVFGNADLDTELNAFGRDLLAFHLTPAALGVYKMMLAEGGQEGLLISFMQAGPNRILKPLTAFLQKRHPKLDDAAFHAQMFAVMVLAPRNRQILKGKGSIICAKQARHVDKVVKLFLQGIQT